MGIFTLRFVTVDAFREEVVNYLVKMTERYTQYTIVVESKNNAKKPEGWDFEYYPHYVPEGYVIENISQLKYRANISYSNSQNLTYKVQIYDAVYGNFRRNDSENAQYKSVEINGMQGELYLKDSHNTVVFANEKYVFCVTGDLSQDELILVARSIKDEE